MSLQPQSHERVSACGRIESRPDYILVGIDAEDAHHIYRTTDETVHVIQDAEHSCRYDLGAARQCINDWIEYVKAERGFRTQHLFTSLTSSVLNDLEGENE